MNDHVDLVRGLVRKAESDVVAMNASLDAGAFDAACFHAQQAVEKYVKGFLASKQIPFPYTHNLSRLVNACIEVEPALESLSDIVEPLTPYAVELRYDFDFWPTREDAEAARRAVAAVRDAIAPRLP